ncbi:type II secretion system F family protein [Asticcacaulis sp. 201]|uniref:type II secretion system F family protein n=1 Tax=Asticcacaulis sp. 201 TaxID=3028787 RepID=UPI002915E660|nr:type II secretion system F family protein [Asticcacaulis sp. 201]MDV6331318.1 type II secretion system F family protein [Asticcacaulis sp. 201]
MPTFTYKAIQTDGKTRKGQILASDEADAFAKLRVENLSPISLKAQPATFAADQAKKSFGTDRTEMSEAETEALLTSLAVLLRAGADIRTALGVLSTDDPALKAVTQKMLGGSSVEAGLSPLFGSQNAHLGALIAAGEARGDLPSGLEAAANVIATRRKIREQLFEALSYPVFVFITAIAAIGIILLVVVPAIAPLLQDTGQAMPVYFRIIVWLSDAFRATWAWLLIALMAATGASILGYLYGGLKRHIETWLLDGPVNGIVRGLIFGGYAKTLGDTLSRGASLTDGLRLCQKSISNSVARDRLETVLMSIRQGRSLSESLLGVKGFPRAAIKLAEVGEASSALGVMLARAGEREETTALAKISKLSKLLGPILIMILGAMIGLIMGGVLTALTDIGSIAGT